MKVKILSKMMMKNSPYLWRMSERCSTNEEDLTIAKEHGKAKKKGEEIRLTLATIARSQTTSLWIVRTWRTKHLHWKSHIKRRQWRLLGIQKVNPKGISTYWMFVSWLNMTIQTRYAPNLQDVESGGILIIVTLTKSDREKIMHDKCVLWNYELKVRVLASSILPL